MSSETDGLTGYMLGYARVSTIDQDEALQRDALLAGGCQRIFVDKASGKLEQTGTHRDVGSTPIGRHRGRLAAGPARQVVTTPD